jgi:ABC-type multidrug transport system, permease component
MRQFLSFLQKEFYHIFRDMRTTIIMIGIPVILIVLFGYAVSTEIKSARFIVLDVNRSEVGQRIIERMDANEYFDYYMSVNSYEEVRTVMRRGEAKMAIIFASGFDANPNASEVQLLIDATAPNEATALSEYATQIINEEIRNLKVNTSNTGNGIATIRPVVHLLYNPQMKDSYNFVPGVMGMIMILICSLMTSVGIVREKETGSMEILLVSPLKPMYIILAKAVPYLLVSLVNVITILLLAHFLLDVPIIGSITTVLFLSILYSLLALSLGLLISTITETQKAAMLASAVALMLPVMLLSGMIFPIENMPLALQVLSNVVPARWYISALRDVMIKGVSIMDILPEIIILTSMTIGLIGLSVKRFKIRLE